MVCLLQCALFFIITINGALSLLKPFCPVDVPGTDTKTKDQGQQCERFMVPAFKITICVEEGLCGTGTQFYTSKPSNGGAELVYKLVFDVTGEYRSDTFNILITSKPKVNQEGVIVENIGKMETLGRIKTVKVYSTKVSGSQTDKIGAFELGTIKFSYGSPDGKYDLEFVYGEMVHSQQSDKTANFWNNEYKAEPKHQAPCLWVVSLSLRKPQWYRAGCALPENAEPMTETIGCRVPGERFAVQFCVNEQGERDCEKMDKDVPEDDCDDKLTDYAKKAAYYKKYQAYLKAVTTTTTHQPKQDVRTNTSEMGNHKDNNTTTYKTTTNNTKGKKTGWVIIILCIVGGLLLLALIIGLIYWFLIRKKRGKRGQKKKGARDDETEVESEATEVPRKSKKKEKSRPKNKKGGRAPKDENESSVRKPTPMLQGPSPDENSAWTVMAAPGQPPQQNRAPAPQFIGHQPQQPPMVTPAVRPTSVPTPNDGRTVALFK